MQWPTGGYCRRAMSWTRSLPTASTAFGTRDRGSTLIDPSARRMEREVVTLTAMATSHFKSRSDRYASHPRPRSPHELTAHRCINFRHASSGVYHWEFDKGRKSLSVAVKGPLIVDDVEVLLHAASEGVGLA